MADGSVDRRQPVRGRGDSDSLDLAFRIGMVVAVIVFTLNMAAELGA